MFKSIIIFILVFGLLVFIHELGHFFFAKRAGILVREFAIGFGPKLLSVKKGETAYTVRMLPLGGYVMMAGYEEEEDLRPGMQVNLTIKDDLVTAIDLTNDSSFQNGVMMQVTDFDLEKDLCIKGMVFDQPEESMFRVSRTATIKNEDGVIMQIAPLDRQFNNAPLIDRMLTNFAGPLNNFILAIITFMIVAFLQGGVFSNQSFVGEVQPNTPASEAGLQAGDEITAINGKKIDSWVDMSQTIAENVDHEITVDVNRGDEQLQVEITPELATLEDGTEYARIGVARHIDRSISSILTYGFTETWAVIALIFEALGSMTIGRTGVDQLGGPLAVFAVTDSVVQTSGLVGVLGLLGTLSANLGLVNLIPIPGLDGGKLLLNVVEGVRGKKLSQEKEIVITLIGAGFLILLMLVVTWNDIQQFFF